MTLYKELGVEKGASAEEIKKAYKKEALARHPDRGGDKAGFQRLQAAYDTLSNPEKRAYYDSTGQVPDENQNQGGMPDLSAVFGSMFGSGGPGPGGPFGSMFGSFGSPFGSPFGSQGPQGPVRAEKGPNKLHDIGVSLANLYTGKAFTLNMKRDVVCHGCSGSGGSRMETCNTCGGKGVRVRAMQMGPIMTMSHERCVSCNQTGKRVAEECKVCRGRKLLENEINLEVVIEPGMQEGDRIVFAEKCSESTQYNVPGDVVLVIRSISGESEAWTRRGNDLTITVSLNLAESLLGWERQIEGHPSGRPLHIVWSGVLRDNDNIIVPNWGMPEKGTDRKGSLIVVCRVNCQRVLSEDQQNTLKKVWPEWVTPTMKADTVTGHLGSG
jgi:DnaJ family protein A protein 2